MVPHKPHESTLDDDVYLLNLHILRYDIIDACVNVNKHKGTVCVCVCIPNFEVLDISPSPSSQ